MNSTMNSIFSSGLESRRRTPMVPNSCRTNVFTTPTPSGSRASVVQCGYESNVILAIAEGRGQARGEVGIACLDLYSPHLILSQFSDTQTYTKVLAKLNIFRPVEVLMSATSCDVVGQPTRLFVQLEREAPNSPVVALQRRIFNATNGLDRVQSLVAEPFSSVVTMVSEKYYSLAAAAALLKYVELVRSVVFMPKTLKIEFQGSEQTVMIDSTTARHLELLQNNYLPNSAQSLLGILNTCRTPGGSRLLRMNILQPPCDVDLINHRLDCVQELMDNAEIIHGLMRVLSQLPRDLEHALVSLIQIPRIENNRVLEQRINYVIFIKQALTLLPVFIQVLENADNEYFQAVRENFANPKFEGMLDRIQSVINEEAQMAKGTASMRIQRSFAVKPDINPILDIARQAYCELQEDLNNYVVELGREHKLNLRLLESTTRGFYIQFILTGKAWEIPPLPGYFLNVHKKRNLVTFTTETLLLTEQRIREIVAEIQTISSIVVSELVSNMREDIDSLYIVSEAVATLDMMQSLATYSLTTMNAVRPTFSYHSTAIHMGRHPILDCISEIQTIPNNTFITNDTNIAIITGPNMSGKTTYLKQVATLQILAQLGCFVPAESAVFRAVDCIFSRIGNGDSIESSASTFALEMAEMNYILKNVTDSSLVIIDELGRATSIEEGTAMSWSIAEALLPTKAFVLLATHYLYITKMESLYMNVLNYKMETLESESRIPEAEERRRNALLPGTSNEASPMNTWKLHYSHVIKRGVTDLEYYGLKLANTSSFPPNVLRRAMTLTRRITESRKRRPQIAGEGEEEGRTRQSRLLLGIQLYLAAEAIVQGGHNDRNIVRGYLACLKQEFLTYSAKFK